MCRQSREQGERARPGLKERTGQNHDAGRGAEGQDTASTVQGPQGPQGPVGRCKLAGRAPGWKLRPWPDLLVLTMRCHAESPTFSRTNMGNEGQRRPSSCPHLVIAHNACLFCASLVVCCRYSRCRACSPCSPQITHYPWILLFAIPKSAIVVLLYEARAD